MDFRRINSKGFVLIETLAVTVFAASIFFFLFKSVAPLMGYYNNRVEQMGNVDAIFNTYNVRKFLYRDEYFNNASAANDNKAIKNLPKGYTLITCGNKNKRHTKQTPTGDNVYYFTELYSKDYCRSLMTNMGAYDAMDPDNLNDDKEYYWMFLVHGSELEINPSTGTSNFASAGIDFYVSYGAFPDGDADSPEVVREMALTYAESDNFNTMKDKDFLIFYYWHLNPNYVEEDVLAGKSIESKYKDSINILPVVTSNDSLNCFKYQIIPNNKYFYEQKNTNTLYYFFHDDAKYNIYQKYINESGTLANKIDKCVSGTTGTVYNGNTLTLNSPLARDNCERILESNNIQFYTIYKLDFNYSSNVENTTLANCRHYFESKNMTASAARTYCLNTFNGEKLNSDWDNFIYARFAEASYNYDDSETEVAIIGYDTKCTKDIIIPKTVYGKKISVIGYNAFKNKGVRSVQINENVKIIDEGAIDSTTEIKNASGTKMVNSNFKISNGIKYPKWN